MFRFWTELPRSRQTRHRQLAVMAVCSNLLLIYLFGFSQERWVDINELKAESINWRLSMSLAYSAILFWVVTMGIGPVRVWLGRPLSANLMLRRDIGIWAGVLSLAHLIVGSFMHTSGLQLWTLFIKEWPSWDNLLPLQFNRFGLANFTGLFQGVVILFVLMISSDRAMRQLGVTRWKWGQRAVYLAFISMIAHAFLYQSLEARDMRLRIGLMTVLGVVVSLQLLGVFLYKRR